MLRNLGFRLRPLIGTLTAIVVIIGIVTVLAIVRALTSPEATADKLALVGDVLAGATLLLAIVASSVALLAYAVSTGLPDLQISIEFGLHSYDSGPNNLVFDAEIPKDGTIRAKAHMEGISGSGPDKQTTMAVRLRNNSGYSAKNPAVIVKLGAMAFFDNKHLSKSWVITDYYEFSDEFPGLGTGYVSVQWDGGPAYSIHGHSIRRLPDLDLSGLYALWSWGLPDLEIMILADGYRREVTLPVDFVVDGISEVRDDDWEVIPEWM